MRALGAAVGLAAMLASACVSAGGPVTRRGMHPPDPPVPPVTSVGPISYPETARASGIDGGVHVLFKRTGEIEALTGPGELRLAALSHARTWRFATPLKADLNVGYSFVLLPADCSNDQSESTRVEPPRFIEVVARKLADCEGRGDAEGPVPALAHTAFFGLSPILAQAAVEGAVRLRITTDGSRVVAAETSGVREPSPLNSGLLLSYAMEVVRRWRFEPHAPTSFDTLIEVQRSTDGGCARVDFGDPPSFIGRLPTEHRVLNAVMYLCHPPPPPPIQLPYVVRSLRGVLSCTCNDKRRVAHRRLSVSGPSRAWSSTMTDADGRFSFEAMPSGTYTLSIDDSSGIVTRWFEIQVSATASEAPVRLEVDWDPAFDFGPRSAWVKTRTIPGYAPELRRAGLEGEIEVHVDATGAVSGKGPEPLVAAAVATVRQWTFEDPDKQGADVRFVYRLVPGDCDRDQNPVVVWRWNRIEIIGKRPIACTR